MLQTLYKKLKLFFSWPFKRSYKKKWPVVLAVVLMVGVGLLFMAKPAEADVFSWSMDLIAKTLSYIFLWVASILGKILIVIINILIGIVQYNDFGDAKAVNDGWIVVRDICNMFFVVVLLIIAFGTILRIENYKYNRLLAKLILMAVLVNFSKLIALFFIDLGQVVMLTFVNAFADTAAGNFTSVLKLRDMLGFTPVAGVGDIDVASAPSKSDLVGAPLLAVIMLIVALLTMLAMVVVFLVRIIVLWILVVLSPLAYLLSVLPMGARYSQQWWSTFGKWVTTGPILAFFIWLSLTVLTSQTAADLGLESKEAGSEIFSEGVISGSITAVSSSKNILGFIIGIAMLMIALSVASSLGGMAGSVAGKMAGKVKSMGARSLRIAGAPFGGAYKAAGYGASRGVAYVGRKFRESDSKILNMMTPEFWKGFAKRGERLEDRAKRRALGKGEYYAELKFKGKAAAMDRQELAERAITEELKGDFKKEMGPAGQSRQAMMDLSRRQYMTGAFEGEEARQAFLELAAGQGNLDDVYYGFAEMYKKKPEMREKIREEFGQKGWGSDELDEMFNKYNATRVRTFSASFLGLDRKFVEGEKDEKGNVVKTSRELGVKSSDEDQRRLRAMAGISEAVKDVGHWEQFAATKDITEGKYYIMGEQERRDEIVGEAKKRGLREFLRQIAPHVFLEREWTTVRDDETGRLVEDKNGEYIDGKHGLGEIVEREGKLMQLNEEGKWIEAKKYQHDFVSSHLAPEAGSAEEEMFRRLLGGQHIPELRQMQSRIPDQLIGRYFDNMGNLIDSEEEAVEAGFTEVFDERTGKRKSARENLKDNFMKLYEANPIVMKGFYNWKFRNRPDNAPSVYPWEPGFKQIPHAEQEDKIRQELRQAVGFEDAESQARQYGVDTEDAVNIKKLTEIIGELHNPDYAAHKGKVSYGDVTELSKTMEDRQVKWDPKRWKPGKEEEGEEKVKQLTKIEEDLKKEDLPANDRRDKEVAKENLKTEIADLKGYWKEPRPRQPDETDEQFKRRQYPEHGKYLEGKVTELATIELKKLIQGKVQDLTKENGEKLTDDEINEFMDKLVAVDRRKPPEKGPEPVPTEPVSPPPKPAPGERVIPDTEGELAKYGNKQFEKFSSLDLKEFQDKFTQDDLQHLKDYLLKDREVAAREGTGPNPGTVVAALGSEGAPVGTLQRIMSSMQDKVVDFNEMLGMNMAEVMEKYFDVDIKKEIPKYESVFSGKAQGAAPPEPMRSAEEVFEKGEGPEPAPRPAPSEKAPPEAALTPELDKEIASRKAELNKLDEEITILKDRAPDDPAIKEKEAKRNAIEKEIIGKDSERIEQTRQASAKPDQAEALVGGEAVEGHLAGMQRITGRIEQALGATAGRIEDFDSLIKDMGENLNDFTKSLGKRTKELGDKLSKNEKNSAKDLANHLKDVQSRVQDAGKGTYAMGISDQRYMLYQLIALVKAIRESAKQPATQVLHLARRSTEGYLPSGKSGVGVAKTGSETGDTGNE